MKLKTLAGCRIIGVGWLMGLLAALSGAFGCDTVAEISFEVRRFNEASTAGFLNADLCDTTDTRVRFKFVLLDRDDQLIEPGDRISDGVLTVSGSNANFRAREHVSFSEQSYLFPSPDITCFSDADCPTPYRCVPINPFNAAGAATACGAQVNLEVFQSPIEFVRGSQAKSIGLVMDYSESLLGVNEDGSFNRDRSTDRDDRRIAAADTFVRKFGQGPFAEDSLICVAAFGGQGRAGVSFLPTVEGCLTGDYDAAARRVGQLNVGEDGDSPLWSAILETIEQQLSGAPGDRAIVLFTDGLDNASLGDTFGAALTAALDAGVAVHIVQLDNPPGEVQPTVDRPYLGPEDEFAQLACETDGSFHYAVQPVDLRSIFDSLAVTVPAYYQVEVQIGLLESGTLPEEHHRFRIATAASFSVLGTESSVQLAGDQTDPVTNQIVDRRLTVFRRPVPPRETDDGGDDQ